MPNRGHGAGDVVRRSSTGGKTGGESRDDDDGGDDLERDALATFFSMPVLS